MGFGLLCWRLFWVVVGVWGLLIGFWPVVDLRLGEFFVFVFDVPCIRPVGWSDGGDS